MDESILESIKKALGLEKEYTPFDFEIEMHVGSVIATLHQLGIGPEGGLLLSGYETTWSDLLNDEKTLVNARSYIFLRVKMLFDPPTTQHLLAAYEKRIAEEEFRITVAADPYLPWPRPIDVSPDEDIFDPQIILDGGNP